MRKITVLLVLLVMILIGRAVANAESLRDANTILAVYKGSAVTYADVRFIYEFRQAMLQEEARQKFGSLAAMTTEQRADLEKNYIRFLTGIVRNHILKSLAVEDGKTRGILPISEGVQRQLDARIDEAIKNEPELILWANFLKRNGQSTEPMRKYLIREELVAYVASRTITAPDFVSPSQMVEYYEANKSKWMQPERIQLRVIALGFSDYGGVDNAIQRGKEVYERVRKGEDFTELAKTFNRDKSAEKAGLWEIRATSSFDASFQAIIAKLKDGEIAEPITFRNAVQIIKLEKRYPAGPKPFEEVRDEVKRLIERQSLVRKQEEWVQSMYKTANIKYVDPTLKKEAEEMEAEQAKSNAKK